MLRKLTAPQVLLAAYGSAGLFINAQALVRGRVALDTALLVTALLLDVAALYAAGRFHHLIEHGLVWLVRLVYAIAALLVVNAAVAMWRGHTPFYLLSGGLYIVCGLLVWFAALTSIRNMAAASAGHGEGAPDGLPPTPDKAGASE